MVQVPRPVAPDKGVAHVLCAGVLSSLLLLPRMGEAAPAVRPVMVTLDALGDRATHVGPSYRHTFQPAAGVGCLTFMVASLPGHVTGSGEPIDVIIRLAAAVRVALAGLTPATAAARPRAGVPLLRRRPT
eukprot:7880989-Heterocapsa_arctica.AAC.1